MFRTVYQTFKRHGTRSATLLMAYRCLQRLVPVDVTHFMVQDLQTVPPAHPSNVGIECRFLAAAEVRRFARDASNDLALNLAQRLEDGHDLCFACLVQGQLASYCWFAFQAIEAEHNSPNGHARCGIALSYPAQYVFRYKGFTHPRFRGQGLYSMLASASAMALQKRGIRYVLSTAEWVNFGALKSSYRGGFEYLGRIIVAEWAGRRWVRYPYVENIQFDRAAQYSSSRPSTPLGANSSVCHNPRFARSVWTERVGR